MASDKVRLVIHSTKPEYQPSDVQTRTKARIVRPKKRLNFQDRLLRNSCLACALLLGILTLGNIRQPWAEQASASIEKALTMEINLDKSLGQLSFVQKLMPESALVFFDLNGENEFLRPVQGELAHSYSETQPWLMFQTKADTSVCAVADGIVSAISPMAGGGYGILIDHGDGLESVTACLESADVQAGSTVIRGGIIGKTAGELYFELRERGESADPSERMGL